MPRNDKLGIPVCDFQGLICLTEHFMKISEVRKLCSNCISSCEEYEYKIIYNSNEEMGNEEGTDITISMIALPTYRYFRRIVRTDVDFIISIGEHSNLNSYFRTIKFIFIFLFTLSTGGIFGLFFGTSFISILEFFYKFVLFLLKIVFSCQKKRIHK